MTYQASLDFLYSLQKHGIKLGLETVHALLTALGAPQHRYPTLHIGGTNGKGSTAAMAAAMLEAAGYRVGLYTSPHLVDFRERIRVNGRMIPEDALATGTARLRASIGSDLQPTFFEFTTALAFQYFADAGVDVAVVEVGMGGRFDATNVVTPLAVCITNIALDHQAHLGETVSAIAFEKAGIIKPGVPAVLGRLSGEAAAVIRSVAATRQAPCIQMGADFRADGALQSGVRYEGPDWTLEGLTCPLAGVHQLENAACAIALLEAASRSGLAVSGEAVRAGLPAVRWEGRLEAIEREPLLLLDGAHNPAAAQVVGRYLSEYRQSHPGTRIILVLSIMRDKDREEFLRVLAPVGDTVILTEARLPRATPIQDLRASLPDGLGVPAHTAASPADALALARTLATPDDVICVTGSLMLVGDVKALLRGCGLSPLRG